MSNAVQQVSTLVVSLDKLTTNALDAPSSPTSLTRALPPDSEATTTAGVNTATPSPHSSSSELGGNGPKPKIDAEQIVERLQERDLTGQVVSWAWENAAMLSLTRKSPPVSLLAKLWPSTHEVVGRCTAQDVLEIMESWMQLLQSWPRHFRLTASPVITDFTNIAVPAAIKRMNEERLAQLATLCRDIALHKTDPTISGASSSGKAASPRDLMQPIYALTVAEVAIRLNNPVRYVSPATISIVLNASAAWRWNRLKYVDTEALGALKDATSEALLVLKRALEARQQA